MALRKPESTNTTAPFESEEDTGTTTVEAGTEATVEAEGPAAPEVKTEPKKTPAIVVPAANNALANALKKTTGLDEAQNVIDTATLETMGIGAFPRITVDQGGFSENKTKFLGAWVKIELLSWNLVTLITTGEKDNKEADRLIRSSYDHVNVTGEGCTVDEYIAKLRSEGYDKTTSKKYVEIYANLVATDKGGAIAPEDQQMVQISVSPQSVSQWQRYMLENRMKQARGIAVNTTFVIGSERKTLNSNTFGIMIFGAKV